MNKERIVFFKNEDQKSDRCSGTTYEQFIDYAFKHTDFFMLVYVNYYNKGYTKKMKSFMKSLKPFQVKRRTNPSWPGTELTICPNTSYKVVFYRTDEDAKEVLKHVFKISDWSCPENPQDLAFFKGNKCWFYSVGHEKIAGIIRADDEDVDFVVGDSVKILSGPFGGMEGKVSSMNDQTQIAQVLIMLFGRETPTDIASNDLQKLEA